MFKILRTKKVNIQNIVLKIFNLDSKFINIIIIKINKTKLFKVLFFFSRIFAKKNITANTEVEIWSPIKTDLNNKYFFPLNSKNGFGYK